MTPLSAAPSYGDPVYNDTQFVVWQPYSYGDDQILTWEQYYKPCTNNLRGQTTVNGILGLLSSEGATSYADAALIAEFALHDEYGNPLPNCTLCVKAWNDQDLNLRYHLERKEIVNGVAQYTAITSEASVTNYNGPLLRSYAYFVAGTITTGGHVGYGCGFVDNLQNIDSGIMQPVEGNIFVASDTAFKYNLLGGMPDEELTDPTVGPASDPGGYGPGGAGGIGGIGGPEPTFDFDSDPIDISPLPPGISELGFVNIYKCATGALNLLGATLFPDVSSATDVMTAVTALSDAIWNSKLIDYVISIHMVPADVPAGADEDIKIGTRTLTGIKGGRVQSDYVEVDMGTLKVDEVYTNFNDYHTRARLFLPFYGFIEIKPEYWQSATLHVIYRFNVVDGSFIAFVKSKIERHQPTMESLVGQYSGSACIHCPASGVSYASMFGGIASNAAGMAVSVASGNVAGVASSALNVAGASQGNMEHGGSYNASASIMGHRYPYLIIERPVSQFPVNYGHEVGYPLWVTKTLSSCSGLTVCKDPILNFGCPEEVGKAIVSALQEGIIL